jgi:hypothetical protein
MKNSTGENRIIFPIGRKKITFDLGMFPPFGPFERNFPTYCLGETPVETVSGRISPKWGKHSQIENACGIFSSVGFFIGRHR